MSFRSRREYSVGPSLCHGPIIAQEQGLTLLCQRSWLGIVFTVFNVDNLV